MKIHNDELIGNLTAPQKSSQDVKASKEQESLNTACDCVHLSAEAQEYNRIKELVDKTPDVRQESVDRLRNDIESGAYSADAGKISDALIRESLLDLFA
jgi:flagellar biosynthesis anti-sigma factor FlgM